MYRQETRDYGIRRTVPLAALVLLISVAVSVAAPAGAGATAARGGPKTGQGPRLGACGQGELCLWPQPRFHGERHTYRTATKRPEARKPDTKEPGAREPGAKNARAKRGAGAAHRSAGARTARFGRCERLPGGAGAKSFANRTGRPVTVYESAECAETRGFHTHPSGAWTPQGAYTARAFKVWER